MKRIPLLSLGVCLTVLLACQGESPTGSVVKLNPAFASSLDVRSLFDRDTTTAVTLDHPVDVRLTFAHDIRPRELKVFGGGQVDVVADGLSKPKGQGGGWATQAFDVGSQSTVTLHLVPKTAHASLPELELWGEGKAEAPRDPQALATASKGVDALPYENATLAKLVPDRFTLSPEGLNQGPTCQAVGTVYATFVPTIRRAYLVLEAPLPRPDALRVSVNGAPPRGGFWLQKSGTTHTLVFELDPERLTGKDFLALCLPTQATDAVQVEGARLVLVQDDGVADFDRETQVSLGAAADGDENTAAPFGAGDLTVRLDRPTAIDQLRVKVASPQASVAWSEGSDVPGALQVLKAGWSALPGQGTVIASWKAELQGPARTDVPAASLAELVATGSGVGPRVGGARIVLTSPHLRWADGALQGERFSERAFLSGWAESPAGPGRVEVAGALVSNGDGSFSTELSRPAPAPDDWAVTIHATFPDGSTASRVVHLNDDLQGELDRDVPASSGVADGADAARFGKEGETHWGTFDPVQGGRVAVGTDAFIEAPAGAVASTTGIGMSRRAPESVPELDPGMINVSAPENAGYRFSPHGQKFSKPVRVTLPYAAELLPDGLSPEQIQTFFYDEVKKRWVPLPRVQVLRASHQVVSETTHFTFMVNAVLVTPDHPSPVSFNPNLMKDLKAADPAEGVDLIAPPTGNNQGTAAVSFPFRVPKNRGAYQVSVGLAYDSSASEGWVGMGWNVTTSSIAVDTKFGAPDYEGTLRYLLDGAELVPTGLTERCEDGSDGVVYAERVMKTFDHVVRCASAHFEVVDRNGTLSLYGVTPAARLSSPAGDKTSKWFLERVIDANGNLTRYSYRTDRRGALGVTTPFDDESQEDFREVYLSEIDYPGRSARHGGSALTDDATGTLPYSVVFQPYVDPNTGSQERPDVIVSGRMGFKTATRQRLGRVEVWHYGDVQREQVRAYALTYGIGDFGKSLLQGIEAFGRGGVEAGKSFYSHGFEYTSGQAGFGAVQSWDVGDGSTVSQTNETSAGMRIFGGIGVTSYRGSGSIGLAVGFNHRQNDTSAMLVDINGDGLPDRVAVGGGGLDVRLNQSNPDEDTAPAHRMASTAPRGDPFFGQGALDPVTDVSSLGKESEDALDVAVQGVFGAFSASVGTSWGSSRSDTYWMDVDGDGLTDFVGPGQVLFNQDRVCSPSGDCSNTSAFHFAAAQRIGTIPDLSLLPDGGNALATDPDLAQARQSADDSAKPTNPLTEWTAPYDGQVDLSGALTWAGAPPADAPHDGVQLTVYLATQTNAQVPVLTNVTLSSVDFIPTQTSVPVALSGISVKAGDRFYFVLSTKKDFPVATADGGAHALEEVKYSPSFHYTRCDCALLPDGGDYLEPSGAPVHTFDRSNDFRLAGGPPAAVNVPTAGTIHVTGNVAKTSTTPDDVRACIQVFSAAEQQDAGTPDVSCAAKSNAIYPMTSDFVGPVAVDATLEVATGDAIVFRVDSDLSIDPSAIAWRPVGQMTRIVEPDGGTREPGTEEVRVLTFTADPFYKVHGQFRTGPLKPLRIPADGDLVYSSASPFGSPEQTFAARTVDRLLFKHHGGESRSGTVPVKAGDLVFFEQHTELKTQSQNHGWGLSVSLAAHGPDGGTALIPLDPPQNDTSEHIAPFFFSDVVIPRDSPFAGGSHGWRYGTWSGTTEPFDPQLFYSDPNISFDGSDDRDQFLQSKGTLRDDNSDLSKRSRLFAAMVARADGTRVGGRPGLKPSGAFINQDGTAYVAADGTLNAGRKGAFVDPSTGATNVLALFSPRSTARLSTTQGFSGGVSISIGPGISGSLSTSSATQKVDLRDMNGDGVADLVLSQRGGSGAVQLTNLTHLTPGRTVSPPGGLAAREASSFTFSGGMGISIPFGEHASSGRDKGSTALFPQGSGITAGVGISNTTGTVSRELLDVNGDGLPDEVRIDGQALFVRLNYGTSFAANEDRIPITGGPGGLGAFASNVQGQLEATLAADQDNPDADELDGGSAATSVFTALSAPMSLQRTTTVTQEQNASIALLEEWGGSANLQETTSRTDETWVDVNGDGLPDWVRRSPDDTCGCFLVRVNEGYGFGPVQAWSVSAWTAGQTLAADRGALTKSAPPKLAGVSSSLDAVEANGSLNVSPSLGALFTTTFLIGPGTPYLILTSGVDVTLRRVSGAEVAMMDINGDGLPDHVLKKDGDSKLYARINANGERNLLRRVERPMGGSFDLVYARTGNTVEMPQSRYVMTRVTVDDGSARPEQGHSLTTSYAYESGYFDRDEREFFGFGSVLETRPDQSTKVQVFANRHFYDKGLLLAEEVRGASTPGTAGPLYSRVENAYGVWDAVNPQALVLFEERAAGDATCTTQAPFFLDANAYCNSFYFPLAATTTHFYEGTTADASAPLISSADVLHYDPVTGNVVQYDDRGDLADASDDSVSVIEYKDDAQTRALNQLSLPQRVTLYAGTSASGTVLRHREGAFDAKGNLQVVTEYYGPNATDKAVTDLTYDGDGNLTTWTGPENLNHQRYHLAYRYDGETDSYVTQITDSFGYSSTAEYDLGLGLPTRTTDVAGNVNQRGYDEFGRPSWVAAPGFDEANPTATMHYVLAGRCAVAPCAGFPSSAITANALPGGLPPLETATFADGLPRTIQSQQRVEIQNHQIGFAVTGPQAYDAMGRVAVQGQTEFVHASAPVYVAQQIADATYVSSVSYDVLGRTTSATEPNGATTRMAYSVGQAAGLGFPSFATTVTNALGHPTVTYHDVRGHQVAVEEHIRDANGERTPTTLYHYDPLGQLVLIEDAARNPTTFSYDLLGRRIQLTNRDTGVTTDSYDPAGNLVSHLDAKGKAIGYRYDFNRLLEVDRPSSDPIHYAYGAPGAGNPAGRVVHLDDEVGTEDRTYDALGNVASSTRTVRPLKPGDRPRTFTTAFVWDVYGRMLQLTYPDGEVLTYGYDHGGLVRSAVGFRPAYRNLPAQTETYLSSLEYDEFGHRSRVELGNGVESDYTYEPDTLRLHLVQTTNPRGRILQNTTYTYDRIGNVTAMSNRLGEPANGKSGTVEYRYGYDDLSRLTSATGSALSRPGFIDRFTSTFEYSDLHNLTQNTQVRTLLRTPSPGTEVELHVEHPETSNHDWAYVYASSAPHQATQIGRTLLAYDAAGNTSSECTPALGRATCDGEGHYRHYFWTDENYLRSVVDEGGGHFTKFLYDATGQRVVKEGEGSASLTLGTFYTVHGHSHATKHVYVNETRLASKLLPPGEVAQTGGGTPGEPPGCVPSGDQPQKCPVVTGGPLTASISSTVRPATYYYHPDHLGSTEWVTDGRGLVHEHDEYYPYGEVWRDPPSDDDKGPTTRTPYLFTGKELDSETGLTYFGARYYDAATARWISPDPAFGAAKESAPLPSGIALYSYARLNPVGFLDPDGNCSAPAGLKPGQVGICVEAFIAAAHVPGFTATVTRAKGDNRGFEPNNPKATARFMKQLIIDPSAARQGGKPAQMSPAVAGVSETAIMDDQGVVTEGPTNESVGSDGSFSFTLDLTARNGIVTKHPWTKYVGAPSGTIKLKARLQVASDGKVTFVGGTNDRNTAYPSFGVYAYRKGADGKITVEKLYEFKETNISALDGPPKVHIPDGR